MEEELINKVAESGLINLDPADFLDRSPRFSFDLAGVLHEGLILREKDFRQFLKEHPWDTYVGGWVRIFCSTDAIVPQWAFMLVAERLQQSGARAWVGSEESMEQWIYRKQLSAHNWDQYRDERVILKGCSSLPQPADAYAALAEELLPRVKTLMYGEACSTVPVFKRR